MPRLTQVVKHCTYLILCVHTKVKYFLYFYICMTLFLRRDITTFYVKAPLNPNKTNQHTRMHCCRSCSERSLVVGNQYKKQFAIYLGPRDVKEVGTVTLVNTERLLHERHVFIVFTAGHLYRQNHVDCK